ncbi:tetratricopeptide repeat protein [Pusillimonas sp. DMV24BSW_D]|uniref:YfgM family protein n=1 Tax=Neopusillimonas aestuarii TaxID=2716226 RepID=UPI001407A2AE|nr:tetratricopeptide repeat protein [Pusillimonas sp. DMV24BSW_D]QIM49884.1 tetratricopeptide repeat protein [Pusillimonas sp. DMV24BSW_D]
MAYDLEEQEKLDAIRQWWERYGTLIVTVLVVIAASFAGWRGWQWYETNQAKQAMGYFEALETAATNEQNEESLARVRAASETLREDFPKSGYASRGALVAARVLQERDDYAGAKEQLNWVIEQSGDAALVPLARLRLAGVLLQQKEYDAALKALENPSEAFAALYADRRGDILAAQGKPDEARQAWQSAVEILGDDPMIQIIELKIDALGD